MKKLLTLLIFIFTLSLGRTFLVPEEFLTIQSAVEAAFNSDTVSVNFGRPNGGRSVVCSQRIMGKGITFEVRDEGRGELLDMINQMNTRTFINGRSSVSPSRNWQGQQSVNIPDSLTDQQPCIAMDSSGNPWVIWFGPYNNYSLAYTRWNGTDWNLERGVGSNAPGVYERVRPSLSFDAQNRAYLVWDNLNNNNSADIGFSRWNDTCWSAELQVNLPDSTELDFVPKIACGGGQIWCVWYGGPTDVSHYKIYASRWNGTSWEPDMQVSPPDGFHHWFCSIAVGSDGTPHVVWCEVPHYLIYYSYYNGSSWTNPIIINDTSIVQAASWADPRIVIDSNGNLNVSWTGIEINAPDRDIFYSNYNGVQWSSATQITQDSIFNEWYSDIAVDNPNNIWITWDRQGGSDQFRVYASHYDGNSWSNETRLDNDVSYYDGCSAVHLDLNGDPWVVWNGMTYGIDHGDIYYNRYVSSAIEELVKTDKVEPAICRISSNPFASEIEILYQVLMPNQVSINIYDKNGRNIKTLVNNFQSEGKYIIHWDGTDFYNKQVSAGIYFCWLNIGSIKDVNKLILFK
jgi:hypothetical protein